jgi:hypothetical protein
VRITGDRDRYRIAARRPGNSPPRTDAFGNGTAEGHVREVFREPVTRALRGTEVTRNGSDGDRVLELHSGIRYLAS